MWLVFADDSEEKQPRRNHVGYLVGVGAALFPEESLTQYTDAIRELRAELGIPPEVELQWSPRDGSWLKTQQGNAVRDELRRRMLCIAADVGARSVSVVWSRGLLPWELSATRLEVLKYLYDKVSLCLKVKNAQGFVIADEPGGGPLDRKAWLAATLRLTDDGTVYSKPEQIVLPIVTAPSHHVPHLQLADLVAGATTAAIAGNPYALKLVPELAALAHRNSKNRIGGAGVTLWPRDELVDLYWWVFGDDVYVKSNSGHPLGPAAASPCSATSSKRLFVKDNGLQR